MSKQDNGGPAFPTFTEQYSYGYDKSRPVTVDPGMTLRDYFAAKAMQGFAASESEESGHWTSETAADRAYEWADAMLAAREAA